MKKNFSLILLLPLFLTLAMVSCNQNANYQTTAEGIQYKFLKQNKDKAKIETGDIVKFHVVEKNFKDSVTSSTYKTNQPIELPAFPSKEETKAQKNDLLEMLRMFAEGDSVTIRVSTDTLNRRYSASIKEGMDNIKKQISQIKEDKRLDDKTRTQQTEMGNQQLAQYEQNFKKVEEMYPKGKFYSYTLKILSVLKPKDLKEKEERIIKDFISKNKLKTQTTASGLQYVINEAGKGDKPQRGDTVEVNYTGKLLSGKVFDTSIKEVAEKNKIFNAQRPYGPLKFVIGVGQVIPGWDEGIGLLSKGGKAVLVIPSAIAYGSRAAGPDIQPFSPLHFEVELVNIIKGKPAETPKTPPVK